ncbi:TetR/AcrR family transcriptional regulator [Rhodococcoides corynebacterioides]|uniref:TetR/AcrR family transcriptional regulator n=1 Tax=Rhodococcoides corynebacterioides TaxID=53972 RepID=UPI001C9B1F06|nr:TetR/AcrR family transcriptional regulator [Rhodococcus corynebacterioides]
MREDTRRRLIEAGARALATNGLDGMRSSVVARDAGVANGTFYLHFDDREALVTAVVETALGELAQSLHDIRSTKTHLVDTDRQAVEAIVTCGERNRDIMIGAMHASWLRVGTAPFGLLIEQRIRELQAARDGGQVDGGLDVRVVGQAEFAALTGTLSWWLIEDTGVSREELVDSLVAIIGRITRGDPADANLSRNEDHDDE